MRGRRVEIDTLVWIAIIGLTFFSVSLGLMNVPETAIQYWYLYASPLLLAAFRFGLRGALAGSAISVAFLIVFYRTAAGSVDPTIANLQSLVQSATSPADIQALAGRLADIQARDPYTNFVRALSGTTLLVASSLMIGLLFDRTRLQEAENRRAAQQLRRFFAPSLIRAIMSGEPLAGPASRRKELTILFADLRGFTSLSERLEPEELTRMLNEYFATMTEALGPQEGTLDKYIGDGILAFFGDPVEFENTEERAIRTALSMRERFYALRSRWSLEGRESIQLGIGVHSGFVTVGTFGSDQLLSYTVIGSHVNLASRLSDLAKPGEILTTRRTYHRVAHVVDGHPAGALDVDGLSQPVEVISIGGYRLVPTAPVEDTGADPWTAAITRIAEDSGYRYRVVTEPDQALAGSGLGEAEAQLAHQIALLKGYSLLRRVPAGELLCLTRLVARETFGAGTTVMDPSAGQATGLYLIFQGEALVLAPDELGREQHLATLGRGAWFGPRIFPAGLPEDALVRAADTLDVLTVESRKIAELLAECPFLGRSLGIPDAARAD